MNHIIYDAFVPFKMLFIDSELEIEWDTSAGDFTWYFSNESWKLYSSLLEGTRLSFYTLTLFFQFNDENSGCFVERV